MRKLLDRLHSKLGDLWWYSLMIFVACRSGDVIQAFIGLWLVPKYVGTEELGAVLPLQQLSNLFAVPLAVLATVFAKYVNTYATRGEYGKVKSFIRDVLLTACAVFAVSIAAAYLIIPHFYLRLNIASGMLTMLILAAGFSGNLASLFTAALQGLKKFKTLTVQNLISAPIRLVTLLVAMPIRALSGYVLGQATPPATCSLLAAVSLRRDLKAVVSDSSWRRDLPEICRYLLPITMYTAVMTAMGAVNLTVYRQRLPEIESAAYYLLSRFAEIAGYVGLSMITVMFPLSAEAHERGAENPRLLRKTLWATAIVTIVLACAAVLFAPQLLSLNATWRAYLPFAPLLAPLTLITGASIVITTIVTYEIACRRFAAAALVAVANLFFSGFIVSFTGCEFFRGLLPDATVEWMASLRLARLSALTWATGVIAIVQLILLPVVCRRR